MELDVGFLQLRPGLDEAEGDAGGEGQDAAPLGVVFHHLLGQGEAAAALVQRHRQLHPPVHARRIVVAIVFPDAGQRVLHRDAQRRQQFRVADAGQFQDMRRLHRAGADDHLAVGARFLGRAALRVGDADGALALQQDFRRQGLGFDLQVRAVADGIEVAARAGPALAVLLGHLVVAEAFLAAVVVVLVARKALSTAASMKASSSSARSRMWSTFSGPPRPRESSPPGSKCSALRK